MKNGFDRIAWIYDLLAWIVFGRAMIKSQTYFLNRLEKCSSVLILGGGTGWWLSDLLETQPHLHITFVDASSEMIGIAKKKIKQNNKVDFICGTIDSVSVDRKFDAVVLYYFFDLFDESVLRKVISQIDHRLTPEALWIVADFIEEKKWHTILLKIMYTFFNYTTDLKTKSLPDWRKELQMNGLRMAEQQSFYQDFILSTIYRSKIIE